MSGPVEVAIAAGLFAAFNSIVSILLDFWKNRQTSGDQQRQERQTRMETKVDELEKLVDQITRQNVELLVENKFLHREVADLRAQVEEMKASRKLVLPPEVPHDARNH